ncbi:hypothetical protein JCM18899A_23300 [Nocardioides sp. AN3]
MGMATPTVDPLSGAMLSTWSGGPVGTCFVGFAVWVAAGEEPIVPGADEPDGAGPSAERDPGPVPEQPATSMSSAVITATPAPRRPHVSFISSSRPSSPRRRP